MNKKLNLGRVVGQHMGYSIRILLESKTKEKTDRAGKVIRTTSMGDSGKLGVYAGTKKLLKDGFKSNDEAIDFINEFISKKK